jgi:ribosomal protein S12 methylthiotransferase
MSSILLRNKRRQVPTVHLVSLGCPKNQVDAENALGGFIARGFKTASEPEAADVLVVNTCAFIRPAEEEAVQALLAAAELKRQGRARVLLAAGCLVSRYGQKKLRRLIPELDGATAPAEFDRLPDLALDLLTWHDRRRPETATRVLLSEPGTAYLKIAEGCSRRCAFCLIPSLRGPLRSRPPDVLVAEAESLARRGVGELVVVAQDTTAYGQDLPGRPALPDLLDRLVRIPALRWVRVMYAYPEGVGEALIRRLAREPKLCRYLDLPVQHAARTVLRRMGRPGGGEDFLGLVARLRRRVPEVVLRTTLLTGFPGETESEHQALLRFTAEAQFDRLGVFAYSRERGTRAAEMPGQVPGTVKTHRRSQLLELQAGISRERLQRRVGRLVECLVEEPSGSRHVLGRTAGDAPEVDGAIVLTGQAPAGIFVRARVTGSTDHDLTGVIA